MIKRDEVRRPDSCLNRAREDEIVFVLLGRDMTTPITILKWAMERIKISKSAVDSDEIKDAVRMADTLIEEHKQTLYRIVSIRDPHDNNKAAMLRRVIQDYKIHRYGFGELT